jgi:hypothetical protein
VRRALVAAVALMAAGCSKPPLTVEEAARLIRGAPEFREPGFMSVDREEAPTDCASKLKDDAAWRALVKTGWVDASNQDDFTRESMGQPAVKCVGQLTGDGLRAGAVAETTTFHSWRVPCGTRELIAVTAVTPAEADTATARFTCRWKLNAFGSQVVQPPPEAVVKAVFRLLDDGWHVANFPNLPPWPAPRVPGAAD